VRRRPRPDNCRISRHPILDPSTQSPTVILMDPTTGTESGTDTKPAPLRPRPFSDHRLIGAVTLGFAVSLSGAVALSLVLGAVAGVPLFLDAGWVATTALALMTLVAVRCTWVWSPDRPQHTAAAVLAGVVVIAVLLWLNGTFDAPAGPVSRPDWSPFLLWPV
jgi:hypothetical protein